MTHQLRICNSCKKVFENKEFRNEKCLDCFIQRTKKDDHQEITCLICKQQKQLPVDSKLRVCLECDKEIHKILER